VNKLATILKSLVSAGLLVIAALAPTQYSREVMDKTYLSPVDPLIWLVFGLWVLQLLVSRDFRSVRSPPFFGILFVLAGILSIVHATSRIAVLKEVLQYVEYFIVVTLLFGSGLRDPAVFRRVVYVFLGVGAAVTLYGVWQYAMATGPAFMVRSTFGNRNVFGGYLSLLLPLMYGMAVEGSGGWPRRIGFGATVLAGFLVVLTGGTAVALVVSLSLLSAIKGQRVLLVFLAVALMGGALAVWLPRGNLQEIRQSIELYDDEGRGTRRSMEWEAGVAMTAANPWFGVGAGNYQRQIGGHYGTIPVPPVKAEADSQMLYLVLASSLGLPGAVCFLGMLLAAAASATRSYFRGGDVFRRGLALGLLGSLAAFSINSIWSPLLVRGIGVPLAIVLALVAALAASPAEASGDASSASGAA
jgi:O-antigen ligase